MFDVIYCCLKDQYSTVALQNRVTVYVYVELSWVYHMFMKNVFASVVLQFRTDRFTITLVTIAYGLCPMSQKIAYRNAQKLADNISNILFWDLRQGWWFSTGETWFKYISCETRSSKIGWSFEVGKWWWPFLATWKGNPWYTCNKVRVRSEVYSETFRTLLRTI